MCINSNEYPFSVKEIGEGVRCPRDHWHIENYNLHESTRKFFDKNDEAWRVDSAGCTADISRLVFPHDAKFSSGSLIYVLSRFISGCVCVFIRMIHTHTCTHAQTRIRLFYSRLTKFSIWVYSLVYQREIASLFYSWRRAPLRADSLAKQRNKR